MSNNINTKIITPDYHILALCGKSGAGKDTIKKQILNSDTMGFYHNMIPYTTRPKRDGEVNGKDYYFISKEDFLKKIEIRDMMVYNDFNGWYYGYGMSGLSKNKINIGVFNPNEIKWLHGNPALSVMSFLVTATDKERIMRQLNREDNPNVDEIARRWLADKEDFKGVGKYCMGVIENHNGQN